MRPNGPITVSEDTRVPTGGYALVRVHGAAGRGDAIGLFVRRLGFEANNLGAEGWQGPESPWTPLGIEDDGADLVLSIGPDIVDRIDVGQPIELDIPRLGLRVRMPWPDIAPSSSSGASRTGTPVNRPRTAMPPEPPAAPPPTAAPPTTAPPSTVSEPPPLRTAMPPAGRPVPAPSGRRGWLIAAAGLVVLAAGLTTAALVYRCELALPLLYPGDAACAEVAVAPAAEAPTDPPAPSVEPAPPPGEPPPPPAADPQEAAPGAGPCPPASDAFACARALQARPAGERFDIALAALDDGDLDLAIVFLRRLATDGHGPALREIGRMYDPAHHAPETSPFQRPNVTIARRYYEGAAAAGDDAAAALLDALP